MLDPHALGVFVVAALVLLITPGPAVLYIVTRSLTQGTRAGVFSALGLSVGGLVHIVAGVLGASAILATSATAFQAVKLLGAAYLVYLGIRELVGSRREKPKRADEQEMRRVFTRGIWVNVLNPKAAVFFLAFLPQFVRPALGHPTEQLLLLGAVFMALALTTDMAYALLAGRMRRSLAGVSSFQRYGRYVAGSVYIGLGLTAAFSPSLGSD